MSLNVRRSIIVSIVGLAVLAGSLALARSAQDSKSTGGGAQAQLPPGVNSEELEACIAAGTPGPQHERLAKSVGVWHGKTQMFFGPDSSEPARGECTWTVTSIYGGRYIRADLEAELPGMGGFTGIGFAGFDNVSQQYVGTWLDSNSTGIMNGTGELSSDGVTLSWKYNTNCPITRRPTIVREVQTTTGPDTMVFEMFTTDLHTGKEYKCMHLDFTRKP